MTTKNVERHRLEIAMLQDIKQLFKPATAHAGLRIDCRGYECLVMQFPIGESDNLYSVKLSVAGDRLRLICAVPKGDYAPLGSGLKGISTPANSEGWETVMVTIERWRQQAQGITA